MDSIEQHERLLLTDIDELRNQFPNTQDLYREVCVLMFFRYGLTPTANKLYQLVRKGSMSAPAEALNRFWENLREKSRVSITHPDLPESLQEVAGDVISTLWRSAQNEAEKTFEILKNELSLKLNEASESVRLASKEKDVAESELRIMTEECAGLKTAVDVLRHEITSLESQKSTIEEQAISLKEDVITANSRVDDARRELSLELQKMRESAKLTEDRLAAAEKRALLEIDRERVLSAKTQKTLDVLQNELKNMSEIQHSEIKEYQIQIGTLMQKVGSLDSMIIAANERQSRSDLEIIQLRDQLKLEQEKNVKLNGELKSLIFNSTNEGKLKSDSTTSAKTPVKKRQTKA